MMNGDINDISKDIFDSRYTFAGDECFACGRWSKMGHTGICKHCGTTNFSPRKDIDPTYHRGPQKKVMEIIRRGILKGSECPSAKLTESQIQEIRNLYEPRKITYRELGERYGVSHALIGYIVKRKGWKHVE